MKLKKKYTERKQPRAVHRRTKRKQTKRKQTKRKQKQTRSKNKNLVKYVGGAGRGSLKKVFKIQCKNCKDKKLPN